MADDVLAPVPQIAYELPIRNINLEVPPGDTIAPGWTPWSAEDNDFLPPDFGSFEGVQGIFADHRYDAALFQTVEAIPGLSATFAMSFFVRPSHSSSHERPQGMVVGVGIDPFGGTDARSNDVQWALRDLRYLEQVEASVTADVRANVITVFVRSIAFIPGSSTAVTAGKQDLCKKICARAEYKRTYLLLPPNPSQDLWERAARTAKQNGNWTVGASADDAGIAAALLLECKVIAVNPERWGGDFGAQWFNNHYPGVTYTVWTEQQLAR
jgi:hypothetical protein